MRARGTALALAVLLAGCGDSDDERNEKAVVGTFAGEISGSNAFVAVVAGKKNVVAYACDGARGIAELFTGQRSNGRVKLTSAGGARLSASIERDGSTGTLTLGKRRLAFSAEPARGRAGLYQFRKTVKGRKVQARWVVLNDGRQRGSLPRSRLTTSTRRAFVPSVGAVGVSNVTPSDTSEEGFGGGFQSFQGGG